MQTLTQTFPNKYFTAEDILNRESPVLLDIETTGFSPDVSAVFMIGCAYAEEDKFVLIQWLADTLELSGEQDILNAFSEWLQQYAACHEKPCLITYNGQNFDLPFLKSRYIQCGLSSPLASLNLKSIDLYREFLTLKAFWPAGNMKLKSMSSWAGYSYNGAPEGRQLIKTYHQYIKIKDSTTMNLLFLHNSDDLKALASILPLQNYSRLFAGAYTMAGLIPADDALSFYLKPKVFLPVPVTFSAFDCSLSVQPEECCLRVPLYERGLRYYYSDIKNYVYLPEEDYALHKSMTGYIDKNHWQKARPEKCYTWFIPDEAFLNQPERQQAYVQMIFRLFGFLR